MLCRPLYLRTSHLFFIVLFIAVTFSSFAQTSSFEQWRSAANVSKSKGNFQAAGSQFEKAHSLNNKDHQTAYQSALSYKRAKSSFYGLGMAKKALELEPDNPHYNLLLALIYRDGGKFKEQRPYLEKAIKLAPEMDYLNYYGWSLNRQYFQYPEAEIAFGILINRWSHIPEYRVQRAYARAKQGDLTGAENDMRFAQSINPGIDKKRYSSVWFEMSFLNQKIPGVFDLKNSVSSKYKTAKELVSGERVITLIRKKEYEKAIPLLNEAVQLDGDYSPYYAHLALAYSKLEGYEVEGLLASDKALMYRPNDTEAMLIKAKMLHYLGESEKAEELADLSFSIRKSKEAYLLLAIISSRDSEKYEGYQKYSKSEKIITEYINNWPSDPQGWIIRAYIRTKRDNAPAALADIKKAVTLDASITTNPELDREFALLTQHRFYRSDLKVSETSLKRIRQKRAVLERQDKEGYTSKESQFSDISSLREMGNSSMDIDFFPSTENIGIPKEKGETLLRIFNTSPVPIRIEFSIGWARTNLIVAVNDSHTWSVPAAKGQVTISREGYPSKGSKTVNILEGKLNAYNVYISKKRELKENTTSSEPRVKVSGKQDQDKTNSNSEKSADNALNPGWAEIQLKNIGSVKITPSFTAGYWENGKPMILGVNLDPGKADFPRKVLLESFDIKLNQKSFPMKVDLTQERVFKIYNRLEIKVLRINSSTENIDNRNVVNDPCACQVKTYTKSKNSIKTSEFEACVDNENDKNGWAKHYNEINGRLWEEGAYKCNYREGLWTSYFVEDGKSGINFQQMYERGVKVGSKVTSNFENLSNIRKKTYNPEISNTEADTSDLTEKYYNSGTRKARDLQDYEGALKDFNMALELTPNYSDALDNRGLTKKFMGDLEGALNDFDNAIRIKQDADYYYNRGTLKYYNLKDLEGALLDFEMGIKVNPNNGHCYNGRGVYYWAKGDKNKACIDFKKACSLGKKSGCDNVDKMCN